MNIDDKLIIEYMKNEITENINDTLKEFPQANELLKNNKMIVSILKGPKVLAKVIEIKPSRPTRITKKTSQQITLIKKVVKVNTDVTYILALLGDLKIAAQGLDHRHLSAEAVEAIKHDFKEVVLALSKNNTLIEYKGRL